MRQQGPLSLVFVEDRIFARYCAARVTALEAAEKTDAAASPISLVLAQVLLPWCPRVADWPISRALLVRDYSKARGRSNTLGVVRVFVGSETRPADGLFPPHRHARGGLTKVAWGCPTAVPHLTSW